VSKEGDCDISRYCLAILSLVCLLGPAGAFNYVSDSHGTWWGIQDAAPPRVDTGSIRATQTGPGLTGPTDLDQRFAGIRVLWRRRRRRASGRNLRGFGLTFDGVNRFALRNRSILGGVSIGVRVYQQQRELGRWLDSFSNTTRSPITIKVAFGGQSGIGAAGANSSSIVNTASGDAMSRQPTRGRGGDALAERPWLAARRRTVLGTRHGRDAVIARITFVGNWLADPFDKAVDVRRSRGEFSSLREHHHAEPGPHPVAAALRRARQMVNAAPRGTSGPR